MTHVGVCDNMELLSARACIVILCWKSYVILHTNSISAKLFTLLLMYYANR
jgi:hypothetical protein